MLMAIVYGAFERIFSSKIGGKIQESFINSFKSKDNTLFPEFAKHGIIIPDTTLRGIKSHFEGKKDLKESYSYFTQVLSCL
jgi:hypothetical protein